MMSFSTRYIVEVKAGRFDLESPGLAVFKEKRGLVRAGCVERDGVEMMAVMRNAPKGCERRRCRCVCYLGEKGGEGLLLL